MEPMGGVGSGTVNTRVAPGGQGQAYKCGCSHTARVTSWTCRPAVQVWWRGRGCHKSEDNPMLEFVWRSSPKPPILGPRAIPTPVTPSHCCFSNCLVSYTGDGGGGPGAAGAAGLCGLGPLGGVGSAHSARPTGALAQGSGGGPGHCHLWEVLEGGEPSLPSEGTGRPGVTKPARRLAHLCGAHERFIHPGRVTKYYPPLHPCPSVSS